MSAGAKLGSFEAFRVMKGLPGPLIKEEKRGEEAVEERREEEAQ